MHSGLRTLMTILVTTIMAVAVFVGGFVAGHYTALPDSPVFTTLSPKTATRCSRPFGKRGTWCTSSMWTSR
jgi:hypothetical protein